MALVCNPEDMIQFKLQQDGEDVNVVVTIEGMKQVVGYFKTNAQRKVEFFTVGINNADKVVSKFALTDNHINVSKHSVV